MGKDDDTPFQESHFSNPREYILQLQSISKNPNCDFGILLIKGNKHFHGNIFKLNVNEVPKS